MAIRRRVVLIVGTAWCADGDETLGCSSDLVSLRIVCCAATPQPIIRYNAKMQGCGCSVLQCVAVCCSVLQRVVAWVVRGARVLGLHKRCRVKRTRRSTR